VLIKVVHLFVSDHRTYSLSRLLLYTGLLQNVREKVVEENPLRGDSADPEMKRKMDQFCEKLDGFITAEVPFTVILDDPAGNSYLQVCLISFTFGRVMPTFLLVQRLCDGN
jgi:hypothetical protein